MQQVRTFVVDFVANPYLRALLILAVSLLLARVVDFVICRGLTTLTRRTKTQMDERIIGVLHRPIFVSVVLVGLYLAMVALELADPYRFFVLGILKTVGVVVWTTAALRIAKVLIEGLGRTVSSTPWARTMPLLDNVSKLVLVGFAFYTLLLVWDLDVTPWLASAGIAGIAIGFAAKDTIANLFGGLSVLADAPYKIGDFIVLDTGERGKVTNIGLRSTRLVTRDDVEVTLPNAVIANAKIVNESGGPWVKSRLTVTVGVAYGSDVEQVRRELHAAARSVDHVLDDPEPRVRFTEFGDSALIFRLLCWIDEPVLRGQALDALNTEVYRRFNAGGIQIPFPQRDVHIKQQA